MALRIRVVTFQERVLPSWSQAVVRWLVPVAPSLVAEVLTPSSRDLEGVDWLAVLVSALVYLSAAVDRSKQGIHDKLAATVVVTDR